MSDDPFGRRGDERTDAFGRPIEHGEESGGDAPPRFVPPSGPPAEEPPRTASPPPAEQPSFLPPTEAPADEPAWWAGPDAGQRPAGPSGTAPAPPPAASPADDRASFGDRVVAAVVDFVARIAIAIVITIIVAVVSSDEDATTAALLIAFYVVVPFYAPIFMTLWKGQTPGHRASHTRVVNRKGAPVTGGRAILREVLVKNLVIEVVGAFTLGILILLNYLWPLWDDRGEALHDKMTDTRVVKA